MNRLILLSICSVLFAQNVQLKKVVISSGTIQSNIWKNAGIKGTIGQPAVGRTRIDIISLSLVSGGLFHKCSWMWEMK